MSKRSDLFARAKELGIKADGRWKNEELEEVVLRGELVSKATELGMVVPDEWSKDQIRDAIRENEEARASAPEPLTSPRPRREMNSPRG